MLRLPRLLMVVVKFQWRMTDWSMYRTDLYTKKADTDPGRCISALSRNQYETELGVSALHEVVPCSVSHSVLARSWKILKTHNDHLHCTVEICSAIQARLE